MSGEPRNVRAAAVEVEAITRVFEGKKGKPDVVALDDVSLRSRRARSTDCSGRTAPARRRSSRSSRPCCCRQAGMPASTGTTSSTRRGRSAADRHRLRRRARPLLAAHRPPEPRVLGGALQALGARDEGARAAADRARGPHRARRRAGRDLLARHEAAPAPRARSDRRREGALPGRADDRHGPACRAGVPRADRRAQGRGQDDPARDARHGRGRDGLRPRDADRPRQAHRHRVAAHARPRHLALPADRRGGRRQHGARRGADAWPA